MTDQFVWAILHHGVILLDDDGSRKKPAKRADRVPTPRVGTHQSHSKEKGQRLPGKMSTGKQERKEKSKYHSQRSSQDAEEERALITLASFPYSAPPDRSEHL